MMHCLGFSIYSNGCEKRTVCPLLFHSYLLFKHSFYIIPQFMVFLQVKFGFSILFKIFLTPQTRLFPGFFRSFQFFAKKIKKVLAFSCKVRYTKRVGWQGQLVKGLRRRPLTAKTRVRFSYWLLETSEVIRKFFCCIKRYADAVLTLHRTVSCSANIFLETKQGNNRH